MKSTLPDAEVLIEDRFIGTTTIMRLKKDSLLNIQRSKLLEVALRSASLRLRLTDDSATYQSESRTIGSLASPSDVILTSDGEAIIYKSLVVRIEGIEERGEVTLSV